MDNYGRTYRKINEVNLTALLTYSNYARKMKINQVNLMTVLTYSSNARRFRKIDQVNLTDD